MLFRYNLFSLIASLSSVLSRLYKICYLCGLNCTGTKWSTVLCFAMGNFFVQFTTLSKSVYLHAQRSRYEARCKVLEFILSHCVLLWLRHVELRQMNLWMFPPGECSPFLFLLTLDSSYGYTYFITNQIWNKVSTCLNLFYIPSSSLLFSFWCCSKFLIP